VITAAIVILTAALLTYYIFPERKLNSGSRIDRIVVYKDKKQMDVYSKGEVLKSYIISVNRYSVRKDNITPEGAFVIDSKNPKSNFHKSLHISSGGAIEIHGLKNGMGFIGKFQRLVNWTLGCIAVTDNEMDELYDRVDIGTKIEIHG
jgi:murein L,D-transpeptidase YafK